MKSGTTTLYRDLLTNPRVFFPIDKEPENLTSDAVLTPPGLEDYSRLFRKAGADQLCGEASTAYSKRPEVDGVAERALKVLGPELKIIYLVRDPVARIISQYQHEVLEQEVDEPIDQALHTHRRYIDYSLYAMQAEPWLETFGREQVRIVAFHDYTADRSATVGQLSAFLGIEPHLAGIDPAASFKTSDGRPVVEGRWRWLQESGLYNRALRPLLSVETRHRLRHLLLPRRSGPDARPQPETVEYVLAELADDLARQPAVFGMDARYWSVEDLRKRHTAGR